MEKEDVKAILCEIAVELATELMRPRAYIQYAEVLPLERLQTLPTRLFEAAKKYRELYPLTEEDSLEQHNICIENES